MMDLESRYRDACHKLIASIDVRSAAAQAAADAAALHRSLARDAHRVMSATPAPEVLDTYRKQVVALVAKLDEREDLRRRDYLGDTLHDFLDLGQKLGYALRPTPVPPPEPPSPADSTFADVERELAVLQAELSSSA